MHVSTKPTFSIRPTNTSLARQSLSSKMRCSIVPAQPVNSRRSLSQVSNTYSELNKNKDQVQNNVFKRQEQQYRKTSGVTKNVIFKRRSVKKILSESSMNNSTEAETLKQVIVSSLTENVKKLEIAAKDQENKPPTEEKYKKKQSLFTSSSARSTTLLHLLLPLPMNKQLEILTIKPPSDSKEKDELDEDEQVVYGEIYVMNYIRDIMNLLYALELYYPVSNAYLRTSTESKTWKITFKHRTTLVEYLKSSSIAASATYISRFILTYVTDEVFDYYWPEGLQTMTPYKTYEDLSSGIKALTNILVKISSLSRSSLNEFDLLFKKYGHEHLSCASTFCLQKQKLIQKLANGYYL
ncbi:unnamed protein product [Didymodactylos carnosus]|uniref:Cyclin C-terminal domain-containing protein n=1 Tax=Didymodactylos carnosus TaxID=1234261 RepID=A0A814YMB8_9BILA|nr:unnamed protein product [Didymodactylos carnosus]CAF3993246.1 unnamed protein product [Didymodactylos carnosus]